MRTVTVAGASPPRRLILGTAAVGSVAPDALVPASSRERTLEYLDAMLDLGCRAIDTAASYQVGGTERVLGTWIRTRRNRERLFLISKGGHPLPVIQPHRLTAKALGDDLHASLRRLQTEVIDLYLLHRDDPTEPLASVVETLQSFVRAGKIKAWGVSNWADDRIRALDARARSAGGTSVAASSPHFSLVDWADPPWKGSVSIAGDANREARAFHARSQLPVLAWAPLGRGFFSPRPGGGARAFESAANVERRARAAELARKYGVSPAQIALAYVLNQPFPVAAVVAASTAEKMAQNFAAAAIELPAAEVGWLESGDAA